MDTITFFAVGLTAALILRALWVFATHKIQTDPDHISTKKRQRNISEEAKARARVRIEGEESAASQTVTQTSLASNCVPLVPISVNYHFTRVCNYSCGFCFHTSKTSYVEKLENIKKGIERLHDAGMIKMNFAGGEPFLEPKLLGEMVRYCKEIATKEKPLAVSIVSNGSKITNKWIEEFGQYVDILAVSCDSFDEGVNRDIGRSAGPKAQHVTQLYNVREWCAAAGIKFKINTVVNSLNWEEDMNAQIANLAPARWKVFQCLILEGENDGDGTKRDARRFLVTNEQFQAFCDRHKEQKCLVPEDNEHMMTSYLILDEYMRFLDCSGKGKSPSASILDHGGVQAALKQSGFDPDLFHKRGGIYDFTRESNSTAVGCQLPKDYEF